MNKLSSQILPGSDVCLSATRSNDVMDMKKGGEHMSTKDSQQELAVCRAFPGGCGFRGRDWRKGQLVAGYSTIDGVPYCHCGSEMRSFEPRRFITRTTR